MNCHIYRGAGEGSVPRSVALLYVETKAATIRVETVNRAPERTS
jgi:hypothetical protein